MKKIGTVKQIWRYPVKGMAGENVERCYLDANGLRGDRRFAVRDVRRQEIQSCKFRPALLSCIAQYSDADVELSNQNFKIQFPDDACLAQDSPQINRKISELLGHASTLESIRPASEIDFYRRHKRDELTWLEELKATFEREAGEPLPDFTHLSQDFIDYVTQLGSFFLVSPFHIITTSSLAYLNERLPEADWDIRRFRPNIVIDTADSGVGLLEQDWIGQQLMIGNVRIHCTSSAPRCGAVTRQQQGFASDNSMLRTIVKNAAQNLGIYGDLSGEGMIHVGDEIYLA